MKTKKNPKNPPRNSYYWRAVRRLASRKGISISKARKLNWKKEAENERRRRSDSQLRKTTVSRVPGSRKTVSIPQLSSKRPTVSRRPTSVHRKSVKTVAPPIRQRELKIRDYDLIEPMDEEEFEDDESWQEEWESGWNLDFPELDDMDDIDEFLIDFDHEYEDKYKEPA